MKKALALILVITIFCAINVKEIGLIYAKAANTAENKSVLQAKETESNLTNNNDANSSEKQSKSKIEADANGDGVVTAADARLIIRVAVGLEIFFDDVKKLCDLDDDKKITAADARIALRLSVKLPKENTQNNDTKNKLTETEYVNAFFNLVNKQYLQQNIEYLCNKIGARPVETKAIEEAEDFITKKLIQYGFEKNNIYTQNVSTFNNAQNVVAILPTKVKNPDIIVISAHYDSARNGKGAVDNASGVCTILELARIMKKSGSDFGFEMRFCFFTAEEKGYYGAYKYISLLTKNEFSRHVLTFNCDMTAKPSYNKNYYLCVSTEPVTRYYKKTTAKPNLGSISIDRAKKLIGYCSETAYYSPVAAGEHDIVPFRKNGISACTLSWRQVSSDSNKKCDYGLISPQIIHTDKDNILNIDMTSLYNTTKLAVGAVAEICTNYSKKK